MLLVKDQALIVHSLWITTCAWAMYELRPYAIVIPSHIIYWICLKIVQRRIYSLKTSRYLKNVEKRVGQVTETPFCTLHRKRHRCGINENTVTCTERGSALFWYKHAINLSAKLYLINAWFHFWKFTYIFIIFIEFIALVSGRELLNVDVFSVKNKSQQIFFPNIYIYISHIFLYLTSGKHRHLA